MSKATQHPSPEESGANLEQEDERRKSARFALLIQAAKLITADREYLCVVRDASAEGLKVRHFGQVPDCEELDIELSNGETFPVAFIWQDETYAGLRFRGDVDLSRVVSLSKDELPRRKLRLNTVAPADVSWDGRIAQATLLNLSQQGAAIECEHRFAVDQMIRLDIDGLQPIFAKVRWRHSAQYGLVFETTLGFEELATTIGRLNAQYGE